MVMAVTFITLEPTATLVVPVVMARTTVVGALGIEDKEEENEVSSSRP
jgi:hypothetical protein